MAANSKFRDEPKSLRCDEVKKERTDLLREQHVKPLKAFVDDLRDIRLRNSPAFERDHVPYFDPLDGGVDAHCLFLFEAPGGKAVRSGFVSRNKPDESAKTFFELNERAGLNRCLTASWNVISWYLGSGGRIRAARRKDINEGIEYLWDLLSLFESLKIVVLGGRKAQRAGKNIQDSPFAEKVEIIDMWHPSPQSLNRVPSRKQDIYETLCKIAERLS